MSTMKNIANGVPKPSESLISAAKKEKEMTTENNQILKRWEAFSNIAQNYLKPISSQAEYDAAEALLDELSDRMDSPDDPRYSALFGLLATHIAAWEEAHIPMPQTTPQQTLRFLMQQHNLKQTDLSQLVDQSVLSKILRGEREISKKLAKNLARYFHTNIEVFL
jgi:HTH-type transcriptional regulator / antitoxin HigA